MYKTSPEYRAAVRSRYQARKAWLVKYGAMPKGYHLHHKDGNPLNNDPGNLELLTVSAHIKHHKRYRSKQKTISILVPIQQWKKLNQLAEKQGIKIATLLRIWINKHLSDL